MTSSPSTRATHTPGFDRVVRRDDGAFAALGAEWDALHRRCPTAGVFQSVEWLESWWRSYGRPGALRLVVVRRDGRAVAGAALTRTVRAGGGGPGPGRGRDLGLVGRARRSGRPGRGGGAARGPARRARLVGARPARGRRRRARPRPRRGLAGPLPEHPRVGVLVAARRADRGPGRVAVVVDAGRRAPRTAPGGRGRGDGAPGAGRRAARGRRAAAGAAPQAVARAGRDDPPSTGGPGSPGTSPAP
ncbi:hypothetical protein Ae356Ps1_3619c [Pseudonocardia sp. Ae356_Ps1]|nr:hypothetical protein Ae356Ps1_3619c [Pseudonocardia sp. Ae356_Ps1]